MYLRIRWPVIAAALTAWLIGLTGVAAAEGRSSRYSPSRPTVSPYLNLTRRDTGALPNYYALVRPQVEQRAINQQQQSLNLRQQKSMQGLAREVTKLAEPEVRSTGTGAGFANLSHFFPAATASRGRTLGRRR